MAETNEGQEEQNPSPEQNGNKVVKQYTFSSKPGEVRVGSVKKDGGKVLTTYTRDNLGTLKSSDSGY
jgi:hypothetical protein